MRILQLSNKSPFPPREGGPMAMYSIIAGLIEQGHQVDVLTMSTGKFLADPSCIPSSWSGRISFDAIEMNAGINILHLGLNLLTNESYHAVRFFRPEFSDALEKKLLHDNYDLIQLESVMLAHYLPLIRSLSSCPVVLRTHNIEHLIWRRIAANTANPFKRIYLNLQAGRLERLEKKLWNDVDGIMAITDNDAEVIKQCGIKMTVGVPFGIWPFENSEVPEVKPDSFCFIGSMDWIPNLEGIEWFISEVWPVIRKMRPSAKLYLAGRHFPDRFRKMADSGIHGLGEVEDSATFIRQHQVLVAPLLSGSGIRIKIIEAMAAGSSIVSTRIGAEGIRVTDGVHISLADTALEFASRCMQLLDSMSLRTKLGAEARSLAESEYTIEACTMQALRFYESIGIRTDGPSQVSTFETPV